MGSSAQNLNEINESAFERPADQGQKRVNMDRTDSKIDTPVTRGRSGPVRYEIIDKDGRRAPMTFGTAQAAAEHAKAMWPDQEQDEDRTGAGWDIQSPMAARASEQSAS